MSDIKTRFSFDQKVWLMKDNKTENSTISVIDVKKYKSGYQQEKYELSGIIGIYDSILLFESKEELLKSL